MNNFQNDYSPGSIICPFRERICNECVICKMPYNSHQSRKAHPVRQLILHDTKLVDWFHISGADLIDIIEGKLEFLVRLTHRQLTLLMQHASWVIVDGIDNIITHAFNLSEMVIDANAMYQIKGTGFDTRYMIRECVAI